MQNTLGVGRQQKRKLIVYPLFTGRGLEDASLEYFRYHSRRRITSLMNSEILPFFFSTVNTSQSTDICGKQGDTKDRQTSGRKTQRETNRKKKKTRCKLLIRRLTLFLYLCIEFSYCVWPHCQAPVEFT